MTDREKIIENYVNGYNQFDIDKMVLNFDGNIVFENIANGETNMVLTGLTAFREQAEHAKSYFSTRTQTIKSFKHTGEETEIEIDYHAILAVDFPGGLKKGDELRLQGKSIFKFSDGKIIMLVDIG